MIRFLELLRPSSVHASLAAIFVSLLLSTTANGVVVQILDDFEDGDAMDGSPLTWQVSPDVTLDEASVVNGDLVLGNLVPHYDSDSGSVFVDELVGSTGDISVRAQLRFLSSTDAAGVYARGDNGSYFAGLNSAGAVFVGEDPDSVGGIRYTSGDVVPRPLGQDVDLQIDVEDIGDVSRVSVTAWESGTAMPSRPHLSFVDRSPRNFGTVGLWIDAFAGVPGSIAVREFEIIMSAPLLTGDYNGNGAVEQADLDLVLLNWGNDLLDPGAVGWISDLPTGPIDQGELDGVLLNWGSGTQTLGAASVPEPAGALIAVLMLVASAWCWRRCK